MKLFVLDGKNTGSLSVALANVLNGENEGRKTGLEAEVTEQVQYRVTVLHTMTQV